jgi:hypothetical protein
LFDAPHIVQSHLERGVSIYFWAEPKSKEDNMAGLDSTVLTVVAGLFSIVVVVGFMATKIYK